MTSTEKLYNEILWRCDDTVGEKRCRYLLQPIRQFALQGFPDFVEDTSYKIRRSAIPKSELSTLRIYMTDSAIGKLRKKRDRTLAEKFPLLIKSDDDWVSATIISDDGKNQKKTRVKLRLKGDLKDHFEHERKWSFRIEVGNNRLIWGMSEFSIQRPLVRQYHYEALALATMRHIGVLAPRYFFVDVRINDRKVGIMALEEHFTKEMVEAQDRREGPVVVEDESWGIGMWHLIANRGSVPFTGQSYLGKRDPPIKAFRPGKFMPETIRSQKMMRAISLLRDQEDSRIDGSLVFDLNLTSLWWIIAHIWEGAHGIGSERYYFNSITGRLEPVSFDNNAMHITMHPNASVRFSARWYSQWRTHYGAHHFNYRYPRIRTNDTVQSLLHSSTFRELTRKNIKKLEELLDSEVFQEWLISEQNRYLRILALDNITPESVLIAHLKKNLVEFSQQLEHAKFLGYREYYTVENPFASTASIESKQTANRRRCVACHDMDSDPIHDTRSLENDIPLYVHLRPFWFWSVDGTEIELKNLTLHPIIVHSVFFSKRPESNALPKEITVPVYQKGTTIHVFQAPINVTEFDLNDQMRIRYSYRGQEYTKPVILQFRNYDSGYASQEITRAWFEKNGVLLNQETKTITFPPGNYLLATSLETEKGWRIELFPGAVLDFKRGARLKVNGPIHALGREDLPVQIMITSDPTRGLIGSWGGLLVVEANRESILRHTHVTGTATQGFSERQDSHGLTGCVTFYKSDVRIEHSRFSGLQCEDALNIISSVFNIDHVEFVDSSADAFDSDFSEGIVNNSVFRNIVNDGIDVSGSQVQVSSSRFSYIRDKAISVGENSTLDATELIIVDADAGIVSKDKSAVNIRNSSFKGVNNALMAYVKKEAWGPPAEIHCDNCLFDHVENIAVEQYASRITVDGQEVSPTPFSRKQLQIAGYVQ